jgi:hypothetical protein
VWIPDLMESVPQNIGVWARPANNPVGGRNNQSLPDHHYMGASMIPKKGSWTWVFFETGNINRPYYFGALDLENTKVLPENQVGTNYEHKWTLFKSHEGRALVVSDDPDDERVEITGQKLKLKEPPTGDTQSVYLIDENMNTILIDERKGMEKILIRTRQGDYFHVDIEERKLQAFFESDIVIKTNGKFYLTAKSDIHILSEEGKININAELDDINILATTENVNIEAETSNINIKAVVDLMLSSGGVTSIKAGQDGHFQAGYNLNHIAGINLNQDAGAMLNDQTGASTPGPAAGPADPADPAEPEGERNT